MNNFEMISVAQMQTVKGGENDEGLIVAIVVPVII